MQTTQEEYQPHLKPERPRPVAFQCTPGALGTKLGLNDWSLRCVGSCEAKAPRHTLHRQLEISGFVRRTTVFRKLNAKLSRLSRTESVAAYRQGRGALMPIEPCRTNPDSPIVRPPPRHHNTGNLKKQPSRAKRKLVRPLPLKLVLLAMRLR